MIAGRYELGVELGRGGMGVVYAARDAALGRDVAVKLLRRNCDDLNILARLRREARAAAAVQHPNAVPVYDVGHDESYGAYLVMERVRGVGLDAIPLPMAPAHVVAIARQVCDALAATHASGIVHRDLKRHNLMLEAHGDGFRVRVMDFGIARLTACGDTITVDGAFVGTARYAAPEQADGLDIDARSDIYSLGVILYELLAGRLPFEGATDAATLYMHVHRRPPNLAALAPDAPEALTVLVHRCLEKDPALRPQDAEELRSLLVHAGALCAPAPPLAIGAQPVEAFAPTDIVVHSQPGAAVSHAPPRRPREMAAHTTNAQDRSHDDPRDALTASRFFGWWRAAAFAALAVLGGSAWLAARSVGGDAHASTPEATVGVGVQARSADTFRAPAPAEGHELSTSYDVHTAPAHAHAAAVAVVVIRSAESVANAASGPLNAGTPVPSQHTEVFASERARAPEVVARGRDQAAAAEVSTETGSDRLRSEIVALQETIETSPHADSRRQLRLMADLVHE